MILAFTLENNGNHQWGWGYLFYLNSYFDIWTSIITINIIWWKQSPLRVDHCALSLRFCGQEAAWGLRQSWQLSEACSLRFFLCKRVWKNLISLTPPHPRHKIPTILILGTKSWLFPQILLDGIYVFSPFTLLQECEADDTGWQSEDNAGLRDVGTN